MNVDDHVHFYDIICKYKAELLPLNAWDVRNEKFLDRYCKRIPSDSVWENGIIKFVLKANKNVGTIKSF